MDEKRAKEIANSPIMASVNYNGSQIYIENVNETTGTANIYPLGKPDKRLEVSLRNLNEF